MKTEYLQRAIDCCSEYSSAAGLKAAEELEAVLEVVKVLEGHIADLKMIRDELRDDNLNVRRIAAHVPAAAWIKAKEAAGLGTKIKPAS